jgi:glycine/D-amino acid oxidase-like deaminating enzyme
MTRRVAQMVERADVVVIGSGGLGAATAFYLALHGAHDVVVVDKNELASQTSPRAAGLMSHARTNDLMVRLVQHATANLKRFSDDTGQPLDWLQSGSLKIARREHDVAVLEGDVARGARLGLDVEPVSAEQAHEFNPFLQPDGISAAMRVGDDLYFEPAQVAIGFVRGAEARGVTMLPSTMVTRVNVEDGRVESVETDRGTIRTRIVVDAAGAWTRQVAEASGIPIPLVPTRHQLFVTEPLDGIRADLPIVRIADAGVYVRPCDGGLLWGVFEEGPRMFESLDPDFRIEDTPLDTDVLWRAAADVHAQLPVLGEAKVREHRGGLPTMTADGEHIVGPVPDADGFYIAGGCNVAGLSISPAIGDALAAWIVDGEPPLDLSPLSVTRFAAPLPQDELERRAAWQYRHFYGTS